MPSLLDFLMNRKIGDPPHAHVNLGNIFNCSALCVSKEATREVENITFLTILGLILRKGKMEIILLRVKAAEKK